MMEKYRMPYDRELVSDLTPGASDFAKGTYRRQYDKDFDYDLRRELDVRYLRMTLVARSGGERMTNDTDLRFQSQDQTYAAATRVFIVETKSASGRGLADRLLRTAGEQATRRCAKYCIGMAATG